MTAGWEHVLRGIGSIIGTMDLLVSAGRLSRSYKGSDCRVEEDQIAGWILGGEWTMAGFKRGRLEL